MVASSDTSQKVKFGALSLLEFWIYIKNTHGRLTTTHKYFLKRHACMCVCGHCQEWQKLNRNTVTAFSFKVTPTFTHANLFFRSLSNLSHCYSLSASAVSKGEESIISLGGHGENRGSNVMVNQYNICIFSLKTIPKNPLSNLQCMMCENFCISI
jgi:hypothetical protein